jgi:hypothetical protein
MRKRVNGYDAFKQSFDVWEKSTSAWFETVLKSPAVLEPAGLALTAMMKTKAMSDQMMALWWGSLGLPTKRDQERALHALNELESRLLDLEDQLREQDR